MSGDDERILRILFISDNFPPEVNAPASRTFEHARAWVRDGHQVTVVTCAPNFPFGRVYSGYRNRWLSCERIDGVRVIRVKTFIHPNEGFALRTLDYLSFMVAGFLGGLTARSPDVVVATSPQFFAAVGGWALSVVHGVPFVFELRDLWPASIKAVGAMRTSRALGFFEHIELFLYRRARAIVAVSGAFRDDLVRRHIDRRKVGVVTNGADLTRWRPSEKDETLASELGITGKFVVGYIGTHGMAHALDRVLDAAGELRKFDNIRFLFVGAGAERELLIAQSKRMRLPNTVFVPTQPKDRMPNYWSLCDISLVSLRNTEVFATVIPSKIFEAMAMGIPIVVSAPDGEATRLVAEAGCGIRVPPEDPIALAATLRELASAPERLTGLHRCGLANAIRYDRGRLARRMVNMLRAIVQERR